MCISLIAKHERDFIEEAILVKKRGKIYNVTREYRRPTNWNKRDVEESASIFESRWELRRVEQVVE